jgi:cysteine synthase
MSSDAELLTVDQALLNRFNNEIRSKVPHIVQGAVGPALVNPTPLIDITDVLLDCGRTLYGIELPRGNSRVLGKLDSQIFGGSVKVRPAIEIVEQAILTGQLRSGQTIFEATSGNFGIALGLLRRLGLNVVALVSRKLQDGVSDQLERDGVKLVSLDVDICPAPGLKTDLNLVMAKTIATNVREQMAQLGMDLSIFDNSRRDIEALLARQDVIGLAKLFAKIYKGFCPEQYDNELNVDAHENITGPEIDQQLQELGQNPSDYSMVTAFGTGGTSTGIAKHILKKYGKKSVRTVFPLNTQDVAGIRTKEKAIGLRFYKPEMYAGQHVVDFEAAKPLLNFFLERAYDIGESSALVLYACLQMLNYGGEQKLVAMLADGAEKYRASLSIPVESPASYEVTMEDATSRISDYGEVVWTHAAFVPRQEGIKLIASSLGCEESKVRVARVQEVQELLNTQEIPQGIRNMAAESKSKLLLVCMVGGTSLRAAELLGAKGIRAESLSGGIARLAEASEKEPPELVQLATD